MRRKLVIASVCLMLLAFVPFGDTQESKSKQIRIEGVVHEVLAQSGGMFGWFILRSPLSGRCYELLNGSKPMGMAEVPCDGWSKK